MYRNRYAAILSILLLLVPPMAWADQLRLDTGDRFTGTVKRLARGTLTFATAFGELQIPWNKVESLRIDREMFVQTEGEKPRPMLLNVNRAGTGDLPLERITGIEPPPDPLRFQGGANAGFLTTSGNSDINSLRLDGEIVARRPRDRFTVSAILNRVKDAGSENARNVTTSFGYNRFVNHRFFVNGSAIFTHDRFKDLDLRSAIGAGIGLQVWDTSLVKLSFDGGMGVVCENFATAPNDTYGALRESTRLDFFFARKRIEVFHHQDGYFGVSGEENLFVRTQNGLRLRITGGFVTTMQFDVDYDRSPAPERVSTDRAFSLTFGYRF